jgi:RNA polymerase sigma-70 factor (ECF subfamily)
VLRAFGTWLRLGRRLVGASIRPVEVNGGPGALVLDGDGRLVAVWALEVGDGRVQRISSVVNPDKLAHLGPVADVRELLRAALVDR